MDQNEHNPETYSTDRIHDAYTMHCECLRLAIRSGDRPATKPNHQHLSVDMLPHCRLGLGLRGGAKCPLPDSTSGRSSAVVRLFPCPQPHCFRAALPSAPAACLLVQKEASPDQGRRTTTFRGLTACSCPWVSCRRSSSAQLCLSMVAIVCGAPQHHSCLQHSIVALGHHAAMPLWAEPASVLPGSTMTPHPKGPPQAP